MDQENEERTVQLASYVESGFEVALWLTLVLALAASFNHVTAAFNSLENDSNKWVGYAAAAAVDLAIAAIAYVRQQRKAASADIGMMTFGLVFFAIISMLANVWHGIDVILNGQPITTELLATLTIFDYGRVVVLSATLPLILLYLGEIISVPGSKSLLKDLIDKVKNYETAVQELERNLQDAETAVQELETNLHDAETAVQDATRLRKTAEAAARKLQASSTALQQKLDKLQEGLDEAKEGARLFGVLNPVVQDVARMKADGGMTQTHIAELHDVSASYVSRVSTYVNGNAPMK